MNFHLRCDDVLILWLLMDFMAASWEVLASTFCTSHYESSRDQKCQSCGFRLKCKLCGLAQRCQKSCGSAVFLGLVCMVCLKDAQAM